MKAIILAAGRGSRMRGGTEHIPKCMMTLSGKSLLQYGLDSLLSAGFASEDIGVVTGYMREKIQIEHVHYFHNMEWESTNMFVSLTKARKWLISEPCIVCYSDVVYNPNAIRKLVQSSAELAITSYTGFWDLWSRRFKNPLEDLETFRVENGVLIEIGKKPESLDSIEGQYMGLIRFTPDSWRRVEQAIMLPMPKPVNKLDMTTLLQHLIEQGELIKVFPTDDLWLECDNQEDIVLYEKEYLDYF